MQKKQKKGMQAWCLVLIILGSTALLERIVRLLYSAFATDISYMETVFPTVFLYLADVIGVLFLSVALASVAHAAYRRGVQIGLGMFFLSLAVLTFYALSGWLIDLLENNILGFETEALIHQLLTVAQKSLPLIFALVIGAWQKKQKKLRLSHVIVFSAALYCLVILGFVAYEIVTFFMEYHYPTAGDIAAMTEDIVYPLFFDGFLLGGTALLFVPFLDKKQESAK